MAYNIKIVITLILLMICTYTDIKIKKIKNIVCLVFIISGVSLNFYFFGVDGIIDSLSGILIPFVLLILFFLTRSLGAGDIKLFSAIGSINGTNFIIGSLLSSFLIGGSAGIIILLYKRIKYKKTDKTFICFSPFIFLGTLLCYVLL